MPYNLILCYIILGNSQYFMHLIIIHPANFSHTLEYQSYLINIELSGIDITKPNKSC